MKEGIEAAIRRKSTFLCPSKCNSLRVDSCEFVVQLGAVWDHFGVILDKLGTRLDNLWSIKAPQNPLLNTKNTENPIN